MQWRWMAAAAVLGAIGCGGGTTCVVSTGQGGYCREDLDAAECEQRSDSTVSSGSCEALGYSKRCPGETGVFRRPGHQC